MRHELRLQSAGGPQVDCAGNHRERCMTNRLTGKAYLVGAGPGDPELLTLKAARALAEADVILIDDLVNAAVLSHARKRSSRQPTSGGDR